MKLVYFQMSVPNVSCPGLYNSTALVQYMFCLLSLFLCDDWGKNIYNVNILSGSHGNIYFAFAIKVFIDWRGAIQFNSRAGCILINLSVAASISLWYLGTCCRPILSILGDLFSLLIRDPDLLRPLRPPGALLPTLCAPWRPWIPPSRSSTDQERLALGELQDKLAL